MRGDEVASESAVIALQVQQVHDLARALTIERTLTRARLQTDKQRYQARRTAPARCCCRCPRGNSCG
jgi:hypothetical protein